jgi:hypothetical protein
MVRVSLVILSNVVLLTVPCDAPGGTWDPVGPDSVVVFEDDFSTYPVGPLSAKYTAVQEYHWTPKTPTWGPWSEAVYWGAFGAQEEGGLAWHIRETGKYKVMHQAQEIWEEDKNAVIVAGDEMWTDYTFEVEFVPLSLEHPLGIIYRVANSRNYYMLSLQEGRKWVWTRRIHQAWTVNKVRNDAHYTVGQPHTLRVDVHDRNHTFYLDGKQMAEITRRDHHHPAGKVGLIANSPCDYRRVRVTMNRQAHKAYLKRKTEEGERLSALRRKYPLPKLWKQVDMRGLAINGRQMRWGDLDGDGVLEFVIARRPKKADKVHRRSIEGMTAFKLDGSILWQWGTRDTEPELFATDLTYQLCDLNGDGKCEVIVCHQFTIEVLDGTTAKRLSSVPTPKHGPKHPDSFYAEDSFERIPSGAMYFCDLTGAGSVGDFLIKDDYNNLWAYDRRFKQLWTACLNAGHYPYARDMDGDGRDEVLQGYTMFDDDGTVLFDLGLQDHADAVFMGDLGDPAFPGAHAYFCSGEEGVVVSDLRGKIEHKEIPGHAQRMAIGDFCPAVPGCEVAQVTYWGEHNIITIHRADGRKLGEHQPHYVGSTLAAVDWMGDGTALLLISGDEEKGGMIDGWGRQVVRFTDPGRPVLCCDVIDLTGDSRDEVVLWDHDKMRIYTQGENTPAPKQVIPLYKPPLHSRSNYQIYWAVPEKVKRPVSRSTVR